MKKAERLALRAKLEKIVETAERSRPYVVPKDKLFLWARNGSEPLGLSLQDLEDIISLIK